MGTNSVKGEQLLKRVSDVNHQVTTNTFRDGQAQCLQWSQVMYDSSS